MHAGQAVAQQPQRRIAVAGAHRVGQRCQVQRLRLPIAALQLHAMAGQRRRLGRQCRHLAQQRRQRARHAGRQCLALAGRIGDRREHIAGLDRRQLVAVAEQDQPRTVGYGFHQLAHQRQVDHRRFIDHDHVERQRVVGIVAKARAVRNGAEQAVQCARRVRQRLAQRGIDAVDIGKPCRRGAQAFGHALGGAAGRGGQRDPRHRRSGCLRLGEQQQQHARDGGGLAGAGAAGHQQQRPQQRQRRRARLAVAIARAAETAPRTAAQAPPGRPAPAMRRRCGAGPAPSGVRTRGSGAGRACRCSSTSGAGALASCAGACATQREAASAARHSSTPGHSTAASHNQCGRDRSSPA